MYQQYLNAIIRGRWFVVFFFLGLLAIAMMGLPKIKVLADYKSFISPDYPGLIQLEEIEEIFSDNHNLLIAVAPKDGVIFKPDTIKLIQKVTAESWQLPYASRVDSISNYQHTEVDGDDLIVSDLFPEADAIDVDLLARGKKITAREPQLVNNLISKQQHVSVVSVTFQVPDDVGSTVVNREIITAVNVLLEGYRVVFPDTEFYITGVLTIDDSLGRYIEQDGQTLIPAMLLLMAVVLLIMTRSFTGMFCAAIVVIFTGITTLGLLGWGGLKIDPGSSISPIVIMTLAVADSIHIIEGMQKAMRRGEDKISAIKQSLQDNMMPVFLTSITTVMGVTTFTFTDMPPLQRLGLIVACGVSLAFIMSVSLLPALLAILPMKVATVREKTTTDYYQVVGRFSIKHYKVILVSALVISTLLISLAPLNRFNDSPSAMLAKYTPEGQAVEFYEENVSGVIKMDVAIFGGEPGAVNQLDFLNTLDNFVSWLRASPDIDHVFTLTDTLKRLNQNMHGDDPAWYRLPDSQELAAQYLLLYEMSLPYGLDLSNQLDIEKSALRMTLVLDNSDSEKNVKNMRAIEAWFASHAPQYEVVVTGTTALMSQLSYVEMIPGMMRGGIIAILMVSVVLFIALRSVKLGLVGMLANMTPMAVGYGLWYLLNGQVNFIVASVAGVCLGVVVDFAVHFLSKYQRERRLGESTEQSILNTFQKTGRPLWTTMLVLVAGFWLLMLSPISMNFSMGCLTGIILILALVFDFIVLPALLMMLDRKPRLA